MMIRFCEFCGNVVREERERCEVCNCLLTQDVEEEQFNNSKTPWPFKPADTLTLRIGGEARSIRVEGTHSLFHLWTELHRSYWDQTLWFKAHNDEILLVTYPDGNAHPGYSPMDAAQILNCGHTCFSFYTFAMPDPELAVKPGEMEMTYQGTFNLVDCPEKERPYVLGWLLASPPFPRPETGWVYDL